MSEAKKPPRVRARVLGAVTRVLRGPVEVLREKNPDKEYRYVYAPPDGEDFGQVAMRDLQGYVPVSAEEAGVTGHGRVGDRIRAGDVMLMEIDKDLRQEEQDARTAAALAEANRPEETFEAAMAGLEERYGGKVRKRGRIKKEYEDYELKLPTREEEE